MPHFLIEKDIAQRILDYLTKQPYAEVFQFIPVLVQLQPAPEVAPGPETPGTAEAPPAPPAPEAVEPPTKAKVARVPAAATA